MNKNTPLIRHLPSYSVLRSFVCAARHQSFTLAAEELHLTQGAISRQIKELEGIIGTNLFRRVGRRVLLTTAGQAFSTELTVDLANIHQTIMRAVSAGSQRTALRIATLPSFASRWLIPKLPEFSALYPHIELSFSSRLKPFDMDREHFDLAVHFGAEDWPDTDMEKLCSETMIVVSSPDFLESHSINDFSKLTEVPLLHLNSRPMLWKQIFKKNGVKDNIDLSGKYFDEFSMIIAATIASLGAALIPTYLIERELTTGLLVRIGDHSFTTKNHYYMVTPCNRKNKDVDHLCEWMKDSVGVFTI